jgi:hypothetical protein
LRLHRFSCLLRLHRFVSLLFICVFVVRGGWGQQYTRQELGAGVASETASAYYDATNYVGPRHDFVGPVGRYTWNFSPSLAIEGSVGYLPGFQTSLGPDNGHELLALGGVKAGWRGRRFGIYGKAEPGIASYTPGLVLYKVNLATGQVAQVIDERRTDFALDMGGVLEFYPTARTIVRVDAGETLLAEYDQVLDRFIFTNGEEKYIEPGHIAQHFSAAVTVAHRFGGLRDEREREPARRPVDIGALFSLQQRVHEDGDNQILPNRGGGAWVSWNFSKYVALDTTAFYSPQDDKHAYPQDGGRDLMAVWGIKAGIRRDRLGYFATVRPGIIQFSRTEYYENVYANPPVVLNRKTTDYVEDIGGVVEYYAGPHFELRADVGNGYVHYHAAEVRYTTSAAGTVMSGTVAPFQRASIVTLFGLGWRF